MPAHWQVNRDEAIALALERFRSLGDPVEDPYIDIQLNGFPLLERQYWLSNETVREALLSSWLMESALTWEVRAFPSGAKTDEWAYRARISPSGKVTQLNLGVDPDAAGGEIDVQTARAIADEFLAAQGLDIARYAEPEPRAKQLDKRTDLTLRYRAREALLGDEVPYGVEVQFAGERLAGFTTWLDDPGEEIFAKGVASFALVQQIWLFLAILIVPVVAIFFVRRYHAGEVGVGRSVRLLALAGACSMIFVFIAARVMATGWNFGALSRAATTYIIGFQLLAFFFFPLALMAFFCWGVGEVLARESHPRWLAGFDALFRRDFANSTLPAESLRGLSAGLLLAAFVVGAPILLQPLGVWVPTLFFFGPWWEATRWFGVSCLLFYFVYRLYTELFGRLLLVSALTQKLGTVWGVLVASVLTSVLFFPPVLTLPVTWGIPIWFLVALAMSVLFVRYGLMTTLTAALTSWITVSMIPFLRADDAWMQFQAVIPLAAVVLPLVLSARHLLSDKPFFYRWDDIPPHVRRIAERERQRVELETARRIQSSILPELPPQLAGVQLAHAYQPASEVGGDFYDVLALEDGRLAVAIGDVAGHGVSSGLVMSMAKAALAVQVTFNPDVATVFTTLNRVIFQSARKRLLATLCYGVLDPIRREMVYASAGHLYPYVVTADRRVHPLEYIAYPLGVRDVMTVQERTARLEAGDTVFLLSDGLVEARAEGSDELFGFDRLENCLRDNAHLSVQGLRDAVLHEVDRFAKGAPQEDDVTVLVLRLP
jgi:hypothetical protein